MKNEQSDSEAVSKEYPKTTYFIEGGQIRAAGNLILTNERLLFLRQVKSLTEKEIQTLRELSQAKNTRKLLQFGLSLHKKNLQVPLSSILSAGMGLLSYFPLRPYLKVNYITDSRKMKTLGFLFTQPLLKRLLMSDFPTLGWKSAINRAVKAKRKSSAKK